MQIIGDVNQWSGSHAHSNAYNHQKLKWLGHKVYMYPLPFGDYIEMTDEIYKMLVKAQDEGRNVCKDDFKPLVKVSVDRKNSISEVCGNICSKTHEHERFRNECIMAQKLGAKFYVLIEDDNAKEVMDVFKWNNPRRIIWLRKKGPKPKVGPASGPTLAKAMLTMEKKYGVKFIFCRKHEAAERIVTLLQKGGEENVMQREGQSGGPQCEGNDES